MANTRFQAKRTSTSGLLPNTTNSGNLSYIAAGEFAVNLTDKKVLSSNGSQTFEVGANLSSLAVTTIVANGSTGNATQVLSSNGTGVYWAAGAGAANAATMNTYTFTITSNTTVITGLDNTSNTLVYTAGLESVFINGSRQISGVDYNTTNTTVLTLTENAVAGDVVQITTLNASITSGGGTVGGSNAQVIFNDSGSANGSSSFTFNKTTTTLAVGSNVTVNTSTIFLGNSTVNTTIVAGNVNLQGTQLKVGNVVVNDNQLVIGNVTITDTQITVGNSTVNTVLSSTGSLSGKTLAAGNTSITGFANVSTSVNSALLTVGTSFIANTTGAYHTGTMNAASHTVGTSFIANTTQLTLAAGVKLSANGGVGTAGQVLSSNGSTGSPYWATVAGGGGSVGGSNTQIQFNDSSSSNGAANFVYNKTSKDLTFFGNTVSFTVNSAVYTTGGINFTTVNSAITFTSNRAINLSAGEDVYVANSDLGVQGRVGFYGTSNSFSGYINPYDPQNSATLGLWIGGENYSTVFYNALSSPYPQRHETLRIGPSVSGGSGGIVYIGADLPQQGFTEKLIVNGAIRTTNGGIYFPDGSNQINAFSTSAQYTFSNNVGFSTYLTSNNFSANTLVLNTTTGISLNGNTGSAGQVLTSNGSSAPYWSTPAAGGGGGAYISYIQFQDSSFYSNGPLAPQQSPVVWWDSGVNYGSLWFYSPSGSHNANGYNISAITVQDQDGNYTYYTSGTDFSSSVSSWSATGYVVGIYGLSVTNAGLRALMANTASQLGSPAIAPRNSSQYSPQSTITANVSGGTNPSYSSGGRPIIVTPGYSNGYYGIYFNSGSPTYDSGLSLGSLTIDNNLGTGSYTYYSGTDFSYSSAGNDSNQQFSCQIYSVSNTTLSTLLTNTIIN